MVDVVVNHFGWNGAPSSVDYSDLVPFSNSSEYHTYCSIDYSDTSNTVSTRVRPRKHLSVMHAKPARC